MPNCPANLSAPAWLRDPTAMTWWPSICRSLTNRSAIQPVARIPQRKVETIICLPDARTRMAGSSPSHGRPDARRAIDARGGHTAAALEPARSADNPRATTSVCPRTGRFHKWRPTSSVTGRASRHAARRRSNGGLNSSGWGLLLHFQRLAAGSCPVLENHVVYDPVLTVDDEQSPGPLANLALGHHRPHH